MKKNIITLGCTLLLFACSTEKSPEATTTLGFFTPNTFNQETLNGQIKSLKQVACWVMDHDGEFMAGERITQKERDSIGWADDIIVKFDSMGMVMKSMFLGDDEAVTGYWAVECDMGHYKVGNWYGMDTLRAYVKLHYDDAGNLSVMEQYRADVDTLINSLTFSYNEMGQWVGGNWTRWDGSAGKTNKMEYNDMGQLSRRELMNSDGDVIAWYEYTYDESGIETGFSGMATDSTMINAVMKPVEKDDHGNWIKLVSYDDGNLIGIDVRTIEYY